MKAFVEKLLQIEKRLSKEKGPFLLFALFLRDDSPDLWDLLVSAAWIDKDKSTALRLISQRLHDIASPDEIVKLSRIVMIEKSNPALGAVQSAVHVEHGIEEIQSSNFFGLQIKHAFVITSRKDTRQGAALAGMEAT